MPLRPQTQCLPVELETVRNGTRMTRTKYRDPADDGRVRCEATSIAIAATSLEHVSCVSSTPSPIHHDASVLTLVFILSYRTNIRCALAMLALAYDYVSVSTRYFLFALIMIHNIVLRSPSHRVSSNSSSHIRIYRALSHSQTGKQFFHIRSSLTQPFRICAPAFGPGGTLNPYHPLT
jgi:hypothetical protein